MDTVRLDAGVARSTAPNGLVVLSEALPGIRSAALAVWVRSGSVHDPADRAGAAHLLEHLVFKGSATRGPRELAAALEARGGSLDAFTAKDHASYQAHVLPGDLPLALDILTDLVRRPALRARDLDLERNVVLEELAGVEDTPDDLVFDLHAELLWPGDPHGVPILGTRASVEAMTIADLRAVHAARYQPANCIIAAAGAVEHEALLALVAAQGWLAPAPTAAAAPVVPAPAARGAVLDVARETAQAHVVLGTDCLAAGDPRRHALTLAVNALGGGMASRLFQRVREELGLAYAIYAYRHASRHAGQVGVYVGTQPASVPAASEVIHEELDRLAREGLPPAEVADGREQLKGQLLLALEGPVPRMGRLAGFALHGEPYRPLDATLAEIDAVTADEVAAVAAECLAPARMSTVRLGPAD